MRAVSFTVTARLPPLSGGNFGYERYVNSLSLLLTLSCARARAIHLTRGENLKMPRERENGNVARSSHLACSISWQIWLATSNEWPRPNKPFRIASKYSGRDISSSRRRRMGRVSPSSSLPLTLPPTPPLPRHSFIVRYTGTTNDMCGVPLRRPHQKRLAYSSFSGDVDHYRSSFYATFSTRGG